MKYESTGLWQRVLGSSTDQASERIRSSYRRFWGNACQLAGQIARDLPNLTLHDEHHFDALWDRADQIAGKDLQLTPLELFVFGGAILIHDAANTSAAFVGGMDEIRRTPEWMDAAAALDLADSSSPLSADDERDVLLATLRSLHAVRAVSLANISYRGPGNSTCHLIEDDQLRNQLGQLIGEIAGSHHWDLDQLEKRLTPTVGALDGFPREWSIRPVLLACLLRCADAIQIDQRRAPDFLMAILKLRGVSADHWLAQNYITAPAPDTNDRAALVFSSTKSYQESEADAWWIAYDAIRQAHRELQACDILLNDLRLPNFAVNRIRNAESPNRLTTTVRTTGWRPIYAELKANRVARIIEMFGGHQLYGHDPHVALRELIQNSIDAVIQRRLVEDPQFGFRGSVVVRLRHGPAEGAAWLDVEDDGIGMSERVLTGPLIDFGESYIASRLAQSERPGLSAAAAARRIGRFGVGFFSVFMLGERVLVTSRPFEASLQDVRTLSFARGLSRRPILLDQSAVSIPTQMSTRVSVLVEGAKLNGFFNWPSRNNDSDLRLTLEQLVQALCPYSEVDIFVQDHLGSRTLCRSGSWPPADLSQWLTQITLPLARPDEAGVEAINASVGRLRLLDPQNPMSGMAAINLSSAMLGVGTIGGLRAGGGSEARWYAGTIDREADGPRRASGQIVARSALADWATDQARLVAEEGGERWQQIVGSVRVAAMGGDCSPIAGALLRRHPTMLAEIADSLRNGEELVLLLGERHKVYRVDDRDFMRMEHLYFDQTGPFREVIYNDDIDLMVNLLEPINVDNNEEYWCLPKFGIPVYGTFFDVISRCCAKYGFGIEVNPREDFVVGRYIGQSSERDGLVSGSNVVRSVYVMSRAATSGFSGINY